MVLGWAHKESHPRRRGFHIGSKYKTSTFTIIIMKQILMKLHTFGLIDLAVNVVSSHFS